MVKKKGDKALDTNYMSDKFMICDLGLPWCDPPCGLGQGITI